MPTNDDALSCSTIKYKATDHNNNKHIPIMINDIRQYNKTQAANTATI